MTIEFGSATSLMLFGAMEEGQLFQWHNCLCCKVGENKILTLSEDGVSLGPPVWHDDSLFRTVLHENITVIVRQ